MEILRSATKIVLLLVVIANIVFTFFWIEVQEPMRTLTISVISFYFWQKSLNPIK